jgi:elongation factor 2
MSGSKLIVSEPVVSFRETVSNDTGISNSTWSLAKSPNKLNRVFASAKPLDINIVSAIVSPDSKSVLSDPTVTQDAKRRARALVSEFKWDSQTAKNVWYVDSDDSCANILSDGTKAVAHLFEVKDTVIAAFQEAVSAGVYTGEPVSNVHVTLEDFKLHGDTNHRNGRQVGAMVKRVVQATQLRSVTRILEPIYSVVISAPKTAESGVYKTLRQRGAILTDADMKPGNIVEVTAIMPVRKSFGFTGQLRGNTHGEAFVQMSFSHWGYVAGLPEEEGSDANCIVKEVRKRKGMPDKLPVLEDYHVKL